MANEQKREHDPRKCLESIMVSPLYQRLKEALEQKTIFEVLGIQSRELSHAALIGWLLDPQESHGLGRMPLHQFLLILCRKKFEEDPEKLPKIYECLNAWTLDQLPLERAVVETEYPLENVAGKQGRADIIVFLGPEDEPVPFMLIEYKVEAGPHGDQLEVYARWANKNLFKKPALEGLNKPILVYLAPDLRDVKNPNEQFTLMNYNDLTDWLELLIRSDRLSTRAKFLLEEFMTCLATQEYFPNQVVDNIVSELKSDKKEEFEILGQTNLNQLGVKPGQHVEALGKLGFPVGRVSIRDESATVVQLIEGIRQKFSDDHWVLSGKTGSMSLWFADYRKAFEHEFSEEHSKILGYPNLMIYLGRPIDGRTLLEFYAVSTGGDNCAARIKFKQLISDASASLRDWLRQAGMPDGELVKRGNGIAKLRLILPGVIKPEDDRAEIATRERQHEVQRAIRFLEWLKAPTEQWAREELPRLLETRAPEIME